MPVQTRNQIKQARQEIQDKQRNITTEDWFIGSLKRRLRDHEVNINGKENLIRSAYEMMYIISEYFPDIMRKEPGKWIRFAKVIYNKIYEFEYETDFTGIDEEKKDDFMSFIHNLRAELLKLFKELDIIVRFINKDLHMDTGKIDLFPPINIFYEY